MSRHPASRDLFGRVRDLSISGPVTGACSAVTAIVAIQIAYIHPLLSLAIAASPHHAGAQQLCATPSLVNRDLTVTSFF
jgi:hypothetical protein